MINDKSMLNDKCKMLNSFDLLSRMVRVGGVEPPSPVWKTGVIAVIQHPPALKLRRAGPPNRGNYNKFLIPVSFVINGWKISPGPVWNILRINKSPNDLNSADSDVKAKMMRHGRRYVYTGLEAEVVFRRY